MSRIPLTLTGQADPSRPLRLTFLGTGSSSAVPLISCLTDPKLGCACCMSSLTEEGKHNVRGNTGAIIVIPQLDGSEKTILIDCGKTFRESAIKIFPKKKLRRIDACILSHHHADAIDGLDDLRAWTYKDAIESTIPVYCTRTTYSEIEKGFKYMVDKSAASGSGAIPSFDWHIITEGEQLWLCGIRITPLPVHHGVYFNGLPRPLISLAFLINSTLLYCSDVSFIPESTFDLISRETALPHSSGAFPPEHFPPRPQLQALVVDCTGLALSKSHFGLPQALGTARRLGAERTYFTDLPHFTSYECWLHFCTEYEKGREAKREVPFAREGRGRTPSWRVWTEAERQAPHEAYRGFDPVQEDYELFVERAMEQIESWDGGKVGGRRPWVRPAVDGMTICWTEGEREGSEEERVWDDLYH